MTKQQRRVIDTANAAYLEHVPVTSLENTATPEQAAKAAAAIKEAINQ